MNPPILKPNQLCDTLRPAGEKTTNAGFRIFLTQKEYLEKTYPGNISALVRFLLSKYMNPDDSSLKDEFEGVLKQL